MRNILGLISRLGNFKGMLEEGWETRTENPGLGEWHVAKGRAVYCGERR